MSFLYKNSGDNLPLNFRLKYKGVRFKADYNNYDCLEADSCKEKNNNVNYNSDLKSDTTLMYF